jgi:hypothetical protein
VTSNLQRQPHQRHQVHKKYNANVRQNGKRRSNVSNHRGEQRHPHEVCSHHKIHHPWCIQQKKPRLEETSSMFRRRSTSRDRSSEEDETVQRLFQSLGHLAITDKAFELQPFTGALNSNEQPDKWVEKFQCYVAFRKINEADQLQLFKLLMRDQAADWLTSLPDHKRLDIHDLFREFQSRYELSRVAKWKQTANLWKRKQEVNESVDDYIAAMQTLAKRINMPTDLVIDAIIQGLNRRFACMSYIQAQIRSTAYYRLRVCQKWHTTLIPHSQIN